MKINIKTTNMALTPVISDYVQKKLDMIEKHIGSGPDVVAQVEVAKVTEHHKQGEIFRAEIHITGGGLDIYTAEETEDIFSSIDKVKDEIIAQHTKESGKKRLPTQEAPNVWRGCRLAT